ncbi:MAG: DUF3575 domain-containing protein [Cruoricaptor ignavus]|nr:DUF3575 domain-containing protein [Cruoricaptor ignavus]
MKKYFILAALSLCFTLANAQITETDVPNEQKQGKNDVMVNPIALILGVGNLAYERHLNHDSGIGVNVTFVIDDYAINETGYWHIMPYYRYYFGKKWANGFFVDGFAGVLGRKDSWTSSFSYYDPTTGNTYYTSSNNEIKETKFGLGVGFGGKWTTKKNITFEASIGLGRAFDSPGDELFLKGLLGIGYRF